MPAWNAEQINYGELIEFKTGLLKLAYSRFHDESLSDGIHDDPEMKQAYDNFCETSVWLEDYALFMASKDYHQGMPWYMWEDNLKKPTKSRRKPGRRSSIPRWATTSSSSSYSIMNGRP